MKSKTKPDNTENLLFSNSAKKKLCLSLWQQIVINYIKSAATGPDTPLFSGGGTRANLHKHGGSMQSPHRKALGPVQESMAVSVHCSSTVLPNQVCVNMSQPGLNIYTQVMCGEIYDWWCTDFQNQIKN